jgi:lysozyme family protein
MTIQSIIEGVIAREGGFVDNPNDRGGATCWGITEAVARKCGYTGAMRDLPRDLAAKIYFQDYVVAPGFMRIAAINTAIGAKLVDAGVNCGPGNPSRWLQRTLNLLNRQGKQFPDLVIDGKLGPATQFALQAVLRQRGDDGDGEKLIIACLKGLQVAYYIDITEHRPANEEFFAGWILNRVLEAA